MRTASVHKTGADTARTTTEDRAGDELFERIRLRLEELVSYGTHYLSSRSDSIRLSAYSALLWTALGSVGALAAAALIVTACARIVQGLAEGIAAAAGSQWLGSLLAGLLILGIIAGLGFFFVKKLIRAKQADLAGKYREFERRQRVRFGHAASERTSRH